HFKVADLDGDLGHCLPLRNMSHRSVKLVSGAQLHRKPSLLEWMNDPLHQFTDLFFDTIDPIAEGKGHLFTLPCIETASPTDRQSPHLLHLPQSTCCRILAFPHP